MVTEVHSDRSSRADLEIAEILSPSPQQVMAKRARTHVGFLLGTTIVLAFVITAILTPLIAPYDPYTQDLTQRLLPPFWAEGHNPAHLLGTDGFGRDYLTRLMYGARITLFIGFFAATMSAIIGSTLGIVGGYFGGRVDAVVMYLTTCKLALPGILIALSLVSIVGGSVMVVALILGFLFWDRFAVVTRTATQQIRGQDFVTAAQAVGASKTWIISREVLPNVMNQIIVIASLEMAVAILVEAILSFLGLGVQPPTPSWGLMVSEGRQFMFFQPYLINIPGFAILLLVIGINLMGDGIRDVTAPEGRN